MFDISEEDAYKFCMRKRIEEGHIGAIKTGTAKDTFMIRDHWVVFGVSAAVLKYFPFFSYYFILKVWGTFMWGWTRHRDFDSQPEHSGVIALFLQGPHVHEALAKISLKFRRFNEELA